MVRALLSGPVTVDIEPTERRPFYAAAECGHCLNRALSRALGQLYASCAIGRLSQTAMTTSVLLLQPPRVGRLRTNSARLFVKDL